MRIHKQGPLAIRRMAFVAACHLVLLCAASGARTQLPALEFHRLADGKYVDSVTFARFYQLGNNASADPDRLEYRTPVAQLSMQAEHREMQINGVRHWLSAPVIAREGRLWIPEIDILKTIDPILHSDLLHARFPIRVIVLDPGHGGADPGTHGRTGHTEKEFTLDMAKRVQKCLADSGAAVLLTRTSDRYVSLENRVRFTTARQADLFVSMHFNSGSDAHGIETYCETPAPIEAALGPRGYPVPTSQRPDDFRDQADAWLAHCIQQSAVQATGAEDRGVRRANFYVLRYTSCPAVLIEGGYLTNTVEEQKILTPAYRERLAQAIAQGILAYKTSMECHRSIEGTESAKYE